MTEERRAVIGKLQREAEWRYRVARLNYQRYMHATPGPYKHTSLQYAIEGQYVAAARSRFVRLAMGLPY